MQILSLGVSTLLYLLCITYIHEVGHVAALYITKIVLRTGTPVNAKIIIKRKTKTLLMSGKTMSPLYDEFIKNSFLLKFNAAAGLMAELIFIVVLCFLNYSSGKYIRLFAVVLSLFSIYQFIRSSDFTIIKDPGNIKHILFRKEDCK